MKFFTFPSKVRRYVGDVRYFYDNERTVRVRYFAVRWPHSLYDVKKLYGMKLLITKVLKCQHLIYH